MGGKTMALEEAKTKPKRVAKPSAFEVAKRKRLLFLS